MSDAHDSIVVLPSSGLLFSPMLFRRSDGHPTRRVPAYRRMLPFLMQGRNESAVYFEQTIDLSLTRPWLEELNRTHGGRITVFHLVLAALARVLHEGPRLNRFVAGRRLYDREGVWISFAVKKRMEDDAPLAVVKRRFEPAQSLYEMARELDEEILAARSEQPSSLDREVQALLHMPRLLLDGAVRLLRLLDSFHLAPHMLLDRDPMYASAFVANLGSIGLDAAYHHLYEHGNCPLFVTVGKIQMLPFVTEAGTIDARPAVRLKLTYDERIEDGLYCARRLEQLRTYIEDPSTWAGARDGNACASDAW